MAEAEIERTWTPIGRWSRAAEQREPELLAELKQFEEPALQGMAA